MRAKLILVIILLSLVNVHAYGQIFLGLDKGGRNKRIRFFVGDIITFKTEKSRKFISGKIENIGDSITISGENYSVNEFHKIKASSRSGFTPLFISGAKVLPQAAALFLISEAVSTQLHGDYPLIETKHLKITAGLLISAFIIYKLSYRTYTVGDRHPLRVFNLNNPDFQN